MAKKSTSSISNNSVALLLVATIVVSLGGTFLTLQTLNSKLLSAGLGPITGLATIPNGTAQLTVQNVASIRFVNNLVDWGTGNVNASFTNCTLVTEAGESPGFEFNVGCDSFNYLTHGFTIENDGNLNLTVELRSNYSASEFIGSGGAAFGWNVTINETGSCINATGNGESTVDPNTSTTGSCGNADSQDASCGDIYENVSVSFKVICPKLRYEDGNDALNLDLNLTLPNDAPTGTKAARLIVRGTTV